MDLKLPKMLCKDSKQHHVIFHELDSVSSLLCIAQNVRFEIPYKVLYFETPFLMIFKYYAWASYAYPRAFGGIASRKSSNRDQKWLLPHHNAKYHEEYMVYISLYFTGEQNWPNIARWNQITLDLSNSRDG